MAKGLTHEVFLLPFAFCSFPDIESENREEKSPLTDPAKSKNEKGVEKCHA
jgi:hypothetical protein